MTKNITELTDFIAGTDLEKSVLIGFYGGGNYGDELLLEILSNLLAQQGVKDITLTYQEPKTFATYHHDMGYKRINMYDKAGILRAIRSNKSILIGGGGLWGRDFNFNVLLLSILLFVSRFLLRKKVYLLGIGYYQSTSRMGRFGAWLAGKAATTILARDPETYQNFSRITKRTVMSKDIAWYAPTIDPKPYRQETDILSRKLHIRGKTLFFTLRKLPGYYDLIGTCIAANQDKTIRAGLLVPEHVRPDGFRLVKSWQKQYDNVIGFDLACNPLALFYLFQKHKKDLIVIGPQYHIMITALLHDVPFMPMVYDNKVAQLLKQTNNRRKAIPTTTLRQKDIQAFIDKTYGAAHV